MKLSTVQSTPETLGGPKLLQASPGLKQERRLSTRRLEDPIRVRPDRPLCDVPGDDFRSEERPTRLNAYPTCRAG